MKFASFRIGERDTYGVALSETEIVDIKAVLADCPDDLTGLIELGATGMALTAEIVRNAPEAATVSSSDDYYTLWQQTLEQLANERVKD